jgi:PAS domain S-box-containing protein
MSKGYDLKNRLDELFSSTAFDEADLSQEAIVEPPKAGPQLEEIISTNAEMFQTAFEHVVIGMVITGIDGCFIQVNDAFCDLIGYSRQELEGTGFQSITHEDDIAVGSDAMKMMLSGQCPTAQIQKRYIHKEGHPIWVDLNVTLIRDVQGKPQYFITLIQDISSQIRTSELLEKRVRELSCLNDIGHQIDEKPPLQEFLHWVTQRIPEAFQNPESCIAAIEYSGEVYGDIEAINIPTRISAGLRVGNELVGWLRVAYTEPFNFSDAESALMGGIVSRVSGYIETTTLTNRTLTAVEDLRLINQVIGAAGRTMDFDKVLEESLGQLMDVIGYEAGLISIANLDTGKLYLAKDKNLPDAMVRKLTEQGMENTVCDLVYQLARQIYVQNMDNLPDDLTTWKTVFDGPKKIGFQSYLGVPLLAKGMKVGTICFFSHTPTRLEPSRLSLVESIGQQLGMIVENVRLFEQSQSAVEELRLINKIASAAGQTLDIGEVINETLAQLLDVFGFESGLTSIANLETGSLELVNHQNLPDAMVNKLIEHGLDNTPCDLVYQLGQLIYIENLDKLPDEMLQWRQVFDGPRKFGFSSYLGVPLLAKGRYLGTICIFSHKPTKLEASRLSLGESIGQQLGIVVDNAHLFDQTQNALAEMRALYTANTRLVTADDLDDVLSALVDTSSMEKFERVEISFFDHPWEDVDHTPEKLVIAALNQKSGKITLVDPVGTIYQIAEYPFFNLINRDETTVVENTNIDGRLDHSTRLMLQDMGIQAAVVLPLMAGGQWFGVVVGLSSESLLLSTDKIRQIDSLADQAASVIQSLRLQQEMQDRLRELTMLQRMMSQEAWVAHQSQNPTNSRGYLFDHVSVKPIIEEAALALTPKTRSASEGGNGRESRAIVPGAEPGLQTSLEVRGQPIGVLGVQVESENSLSAEDEAFLEAISDQVAQALERARLIEQTQKSAVELQAVAEVATATSTLLDPEQLLQDVVDLTKNRFGLYHAHIYLVDENDENLILVAGAGEIGRSMVTEGWNIPIEQENSLVSRVAREKQGHILSDVRGELDFLPNSLLPDTRSEMAVPMVVGDQLLGVFDVQANVLDRFTETDIRTFTTLASQVSVALQNAKLYAEQLATVERLRELDNMKSAFLANMSHELRTPLNSILGFTQVIMEELDGPLTELMVSDLELIEKNGKHLLNMINDVLDMAKIEAGRLTLSPEPLSMYEMVDDVIISNSSLARDKNLYINLEADPEEDWIVMADHVRLRQILINLVGNSIKFTDVGGITIELEKFFAQAETEQDKIQVRIHDTGIGIPSNKLEDIFEAFSQVDSSTTRKAGGTGLGLPISRRLVELHGGRLWAESSGVHGEGATLFLELPVSK